MVATMKCFLFACILGALLLPSILAAPEAALNCCEGDLLLLLDSSGSVSSYEFRRLLLFLEELLHPFSLGRGQVRVGLVQVDTRPRLGFVLGAHGSQAELRAALEGARLLGGDTNTAAALDLAGEQFLLSGAGGREGLPKVLLWLTDGVRPGDVVRRTDELKAAGVAVLALVIGQGDYRTLRQVVTPPLQAHLYVVDIDDVRIVMEDLREAIIELLRAERLRVVDLSARGATLEWRPVLTAHTGHYGLWYQCAGPGAGCSALPYRSLSGDSSRAQLTDLRPDTTYTASLTPVSNHGTPFRTLSVTFTTLSELWGPAVVSVTASGPHQIRVSWGPLQPERVCGYRVEHAALPGGRVRTAVVSGRSDSAVLSELEPDTQYLVTVTALHSTGAERAMSVKACTPEVTAPLPALEDLQLTPLAGAGLEVEWWGPSRQRAPQGYWLSWEVEAGRGPSTSTSTSTSATSMHAGTTRARLTGVAAGSRVCVSPIYSTGRGDGLCCTARNLNC